MPPDCRLIDLPGPCRALILKGVSCDTGQLNVTFCPLMDPEETEITEHENEERIPGWMVRDESGRWSPDLYMFV